MKHLPPRSPHCQMRRATRGMVLSSWSVDSVPYVVRSSRSGIQGTEQRRQCRKQTCNSNMYHLVLRTPPSPLPGARVQKWMDGEKIIIAFAAVPLAVYFIKSSFCKQTSLSGRWTNQTHLCTIALPPRWFRVK